MDEATYDETYAKVVLSGKGPSMARYRARLTALAGEGIDVNLLQVGVREGVLRPHLLRHLRERHPGTPLRSLLLAAGAQDATLIDDTTAAVLLAQRVREDLQKREPDAVPRAVGGRGWHLQAVNVRPAWQALGGVDRIDWGRVRVGQIDTGYTRHVALGHAVGSGAAVANAGAASWVAAADCRTFMEPDRSPDFALPPLEADDGIDPMWPTALFKGHGTRIAATISGCADLADGFVFRGVAPRVPHVMVRITDSVAINTRQADFERALTYLVDEAGVSVVNVSLGVFPPVPSPGMVAALAHARARGVIVVCAAGNQVDPVVAPACVETAIAVAGSTWQSLPWGGSAFGPEVAFSAPAAAIFRPEPQRRGVGSAFEGGGDGTSYATAITSGCAALWLCRWGDVLDAKYGPGAARVQAFKVAAQATCRVPNGWQPRPFGAGIIDAGALCTDALRALPNLPGSFPMPAVPIGLHI